MHKTMSIKPIVWAILGMAVLGVALVSLMMAGSRESHEAKAETFIATGTGSEAIVGTGNRDYIVGYETAQGLGGDDIIGGRFTIDSLPPLLTRAFLTIYVVERAMTI
jgi:hypothetical protein